MKTIQLFLSGVAILIISSTNCFAVAPNLDDITDYKGTLTVKAQSGTGGSGPETFELYDDCHGNVWGEGCDDDNWIDFGTFGHG